MNINVIGITKMGCPKCQQAKEMLKGYPLDWLDINKDSESPIFHYIISMKPKGLDSVPFFVVARVHDNGGEQWVFITSVLDVKRMLDEDAEI